MRAGEIRHRMIIQRPSVGTGATGEKVVSWVDYKTVWGKISPIAGRELLDLHQTSLEVSHRISIRFLRGVSSACRIVFEGRRFQVDSVLDIGERKRELVLMVKEIV